jgi:hypothetical protein
MKLEFREDNKVKDRVVQLTSNEIDLLKQVDFDPSSESDGAEYWRDVSYCYPLGDRNVSNDIFFPEVA